MGNVVSLKCYCTTNSTFNIVCNTVALCVCMTKDVFLDSCCDDSTVTMTGRRTGLRKLTSG